MRTLAINPDGLQRLRHEFNLPLDKDIAERIGVNKGTVSRVLQGASAPGPRFISAVLCTLPVRFEDLFDVVDTEEASDAA